LGFAAPPRQKLQAAFALSLIAAFRFHAPNENRKTKVFRFPLSVFRLFVYLCGVLCPYGTSGKRKFETKT
jgi:hypothetical protein